MPRDQGTDGEGADEPTTGAPAGAVAASEADFAAQAPPPSTPPAGATPSRPVGGAPSTPSGGPAPTPGSTHSTPGGAASTPGGATPAPGGAGSTPGSAGSTPGGGATGSTGWRTRAARLTFAGPEGDARKRRRQRLFIAGLAAGAVLIVVALCAGGLIVISAFSHDARDDVHAVREDHRLRDTACLELEQRLNRLTPPGATTTPQARAVAVRDENAATRIYVSQLQGERTGDGWRQVLDARTAYAEALDAQAKSRTPAFYVAPRTADGRVVTDELDQFSPAPCAGPIRRLATPDL